MQAGVGVQEGGQRAGLRRAGAGSGGVWIDGVLDRVGDVGRHAEQKAVGWWLNVLRARGKLGGGVRMVALQWVVTNVVGRSLVCASVLVCLAVWCCAVLCCAVLRFTCRMALRCLVQVYVL